MTIKALLLNVGVFEAHASVRKSRGAYSLNYRNESNSLAKVEVDLASTEGFTVQSAADPSAATMIRVTGGPVRVTLVLGPVSGIRTALETITVQVNQFFVLDDNVQTVTVTNQGLSTVLVIVTQG